jgi:uncharacterized membrane protein YeiB
MFLFYGIGGGLFMRVSLTTAVVIALGFFAVEAAASRLWLVRFRYGPVEWVWRQVTYWKQVPLNPHFQRKCNGLPRYPNDDNHGAPRPGCR